MRILLTSLALALASPALAAPNADALWKQGQFAAAATAAQSAGDLELAARATLAAAAFEVADPARALAMVESAQRNAGLALKANPRDVDAAIQHALATGYLAKLTRKPATAKQARKEMEAAVAAAPGNALARAALGGWHGDAIADVGAMVAGMVLGAKRGEALRGFDAAIERDPLSAVYPSYYGFMLLRMDKDNAPRAAVLLAKAASLKPRDGFEAALRNRAERVLAKLRARDVTGARTLATQLSPFGTVGA